MSTQVEQDKRIKTESGNWIKQSFKTGKYDEYKQKQKTDFEGSDSDDGNDDQRHVIQKIQLRRAWRQNQSNVFELFFKVLERARAG